jgi:hypothetical protein
LLKNYWLKLDIEWRALFPPVVALWLGVFFTNQFVPVYGHEEFYVKGNGDPLSYLSVARYCQGSPIQPIAFHHAQRFFVPCVLGKFSQLSSLNVETAARVYTFLLSFLSLLGFAGILVKLKISQSLSLAALTALAFNPYLYRLYNTMPLQLIDVSFVCAMTFVIFGLVARKPKTFWISLALCGLTRQTAILLLFPIAIYFNWYKPEPKPFLKTAVAVITVTTGYVIGAHVAHPISMPNQNLEHMIGIFDWMGSAFNLREGLEFLVRAFIPFSATLLMALLAKPGSLEGSEKKLSLWLLSIAFFLCSQPLLGGPHVIGLAVPRLMAYATLPALLGLSLMIDRGGKLLLQSEFTRAYLFIAPVLISFHHIYTFNGRYDSELAFRYAVNTAVVTGIGVLFILGRGRK